MAIKASQDGGEWPIHGDANARIKLFLNIKLNFFKNQNPANQKKQKQKQKQKQKNKKKTAGIKRKRKRIHEERRIHDHDEEPEIMPTNGARWRRRGAKAGGRTSQ